jgi:hypothetical protein
VRLYGRAPFIVNTKRKYCALQHSAQFQCLSHSLRVTALGFALGLAPHLSHIPRASLLSVGSDLGVMTSEGEPLSIAIDQNRGAVPVIDPDTTPTASCRRFDSTFTG